MSDQDSPRQSPGSHHVLGGVRDILWLHTQVSSPHQSEEEGTEYQLFRGITLTLSLLQQVFKVSDGLYW